MGRESWRASQQWPRCWGSWVLVLGSGGGQGAPSLVGSPRTICKQRQLSLEAPAAERELELLGGRVCLLLIQGQGWCQHPELPNFPAPWCQAAQMPAYTGEWRPAPTQLLGCDILAGQALIETCF